MATSQIDYINPYAGIAQQHKDGLDYVINCIGGVSSSAGAGGPTAEQLVNCVYAYVSSVYTEVVGTLAEQNLKGIIANAINGYIDGGGSSPYLSGLRSVPVTDLGKYFERKDESVGASARLKGSRSRNQMVLAIGRANAEYWSAEIGKAGSWSAYLTGNDAIDVANIPYSVDAAMFGAAFDYGQVNANDSEAVSSTVITALAGSIVVGAGKVIFGWVAKIPTKRPVFQAGNPSGGSIPVLPEIHARIYGYSCYYKGDYVFGGSIDADSAEAAQDTLNASTADHVGLSCYVDVV